MIWATRGREWGFRFLRRGGRVDPLSVYEATLGEIGDAAEGVVRVGDRVGVRFPDPEGRTDRAGRVIPHDFVLVGGVADGIHTVADGLRLVWPQVADDYARVWDRPEPPAPFD